MAQVLASYKSNETFGRLHKHVRELETNSKTAEQCSQDFRTMLQRFTSGNKRR